ncbi:MAG: alpha/beta fold hydrolase [Kangiellaceae bacterium]|nr:alpha/beta fold hydrolase [Kangiellaceae bacterium]
MTILNQDVFLFAHGAGAGNDSEFIRDISRGLEQRGVEVISFDFPYMQKMKEANKRRPPDRMPKLIESFEQQIQNLLNRDDFRHKNLFIGGKSMGGRVASLICAKSELSSSILGCICLGFPFHPPKSVEKYRGEHLADINKPVLVLQGNRDPFGTKSEVETFEFSKQVDLAFVPDGDHSFKPRVKSGHTLESNYQFVIDRMVSYMKSRALQ